ncbi:ATP-dependent DNA helicase PIF1-like protein [Tanacetum coccineum]
MRLTIGCRPEDVNEIIDFAEWILKLGDNNLGDANDGEAKIDIPDEILIKDSSDPVGSIIDFTYPNMLDNLDDNNYFTEKSILAPTNEVVETINDKMLKVILGEQVTYYSCDNVCKLEKGASINEPVFSTEFVNGLKFSSVPNHELKLKVGVPIMLLLNIDQSNGLCNGTRLRVDRLMKTAIHATIINGSHVGKQMLIARMRISPYNKRLPIKIVIVYFIMSVHGFTDDEYKASDDQPTLISKIDLSSPLHLHPNDSTTFTIVFVKLKGTENYQSIEDEEVSLVDGVLEGALGALGFGNRGSSGGHGGLWWLMMNEEDGELVMCIWREFIGRDLFENGMNLNKFRLFQMLFKHSGQI